MKRIHPSILPWLGRHEAHITLLLPWLGRHEAHSALPGMLGYVHPWYTPGYTTLGTPASLPTHAALPPP